LFFHSFWILISSFSPAVKMSIARWIRFPIFFFWSLDSARHSFLACWRASGLASFCPHRYSHASFFSCILGYFGYSVKKVFFGQHKTLNLFLSHMKRRSDVTYCFLIRGCCWETHLVKLGFFSTSPRKFVFLKLGIVENSRGHLKLLCMLLFWIMVNAFLYSSFLFFIFFTCISNNITKVIISSV
jgi:hypothetical protein